MPRFICGQALNNFAQSRQGQIDAFALGESKTRICADSCSNLAINLSSENGLKWQALNSTCFAMSLATSQVD